MVTSRTYLNAGKLLTDRLRNIYGRNIVNPENLFVYDRTSMILEDGSVLELSGKLELNTGCFEDYGKSTVLTMEKFAKLIIPSGTVKVDYDSEITIAAGASLGIGEDTTFGPGCLVRCGKSITIGKECVIGHRVEIMDSDFCGIIENGEQKSRFGQGIEIGDHVWIGDGAVILKDVKIGEGAIIGARAVVTSDVLAHTMVAGNPASVIKTGVDWKR